MRALGVDLMEKFLKPFPFDHREHAKKQEESERRGQIVQEHFLGESAQIPPRPSPIQPFIEMMTISASGEAGVSHFKNAMSMEFGLTFDENLIRLLKHIPHHQHPRGNAAIGEEASIEEPLLGQMDEFLGARHDHFPRSE